MQVGTFNKKVSTVDHFKECKLVMQVGTFNKKVSTVVHFKEGKLLCK